MSSPNKNLTHVSEAGPFITIQADEVDLRLVDANPDLDTEPRLKERLCRRTKSATTKSR